METVGIWGSTVEKSKPLNLYPPRRGVIGAVGDRFSAPATAPRQGHDTTVRVDEVFSSFDFLPHRSALAPERSG
jgi:hypothetical protein